MQSFYLRNLLSRLEKMETPGSFLKPTSFFVGRGTIINDISKTIPLINGIAYSLGFSGKAIEFSDEIEIIRNPKSRDREITLLVMNINNRFQKLKGECVRQVRAEIMEMAPGIE